MRVWVVAGEYPSVGAPGRGSFVADQVAALRSAGHEVEVFEFCPPSLRPAVNAARPALRGLLARLPRAGASRRSGTSPRGRGTAPPDAPSDGSSVRGLSRLRSGAFRSARMAHDAAGIALARSRTRRAMEMAASRRLPDVIHAHNVFPAGLAAADVGAAHGVAYVVTEHSTAYLRGQYAPRELAVARRVLGGAAAVIAVSSTLAEGLPVARERIDVVPNVVLVDDFRLRSPEAPGAGSIVSIGRLTAHKRMDLVLRAYALLPDEVRTRHALRIIGSGPDRDVLEQAAPSLVVGSRAVERGPFCGQLTRDQIVDELAGAALLVSASAVETFGVTMIEALAAGVPFVATDSGGPRDIAGPGLGELVDGDDPAALAGVMCRVLADQEGRSATSVREADLRRRAVAVDRYGPAAIASCLVELYGRVAGADPETDQSPQHDGDGGLR